MLSLVDRYDRARVLASLFVFPLDMSQNTDYLTHKLRGMMFDFYPEDTDTGFAIRQNPALLHDLCEFVATVRELQCDGMSYPRRLSVRKT